MSRSVRTFIRILSRESGRFALQARYMGHGLPATILAWIECASCGRIDKAAQDFNFLAACHTGRKMKDLVMTLRNTLTFAAAPLALIGTLWVSPVLAQDENPTTPGAIPNPSTYQGSTELQRQSDQQDQKFRQQQQEQSSNSGQPQQAGHGSSQSSAGQLPPWAECYNHVAVIRALAPIASKITLGNTDPTAVELFDDQSKPTASEKILLGKWDEARRYCYSIWLENPGSQTSAGRYMDSHWGFPATHVLLTQLLNDQLTFGQFNYRRALNARAMQRYRNQVGNH
jgi:hypothetical protein